MFDSLIGLLKSVTLSLVYKTNAFYLSYISVKMINQHFSYGIIVLIIFLCLSGVFSFILNMKHLLSMLLSLEVIMMGLFCLSVTMLSLLEIELFYSLVILTFRACEARVGLAVLVNLIHSHGSSYVSSLNLNQC